MWQKRLRQFNGLLAIVGRLDFEAIELQQALDRRAGIDGIVDDQDT